MALRDLDYTCPECGGIMEFIDDEVIVCNDCHYSMASDDYDDTLEDDIDYPTREEFFGEDDEEDDDDSGETYDDVYGETSGEF